MPIYVNPGNSGFSRICRSDYVDKTGLIRLMNDRMERPESLVCISRPRRFGKSYAAQMLTAYYDCSCDSHELFDGKEIAKSEDYRKYLNSYNVVCLDITGFISIAQRDGIPYREVPALIAAAVKKELLVLNPDLTDEKSLEECFLLAAQKPNGKPFVFIIDEWDALIREAQNDPEAQKRYLNLLRGWFKNANFTPKAVAAAYMTGILPIKKDGSQSAISDFQEYSMLSPGEFAVFTGFTEAEVQNLCLRYHMAFDGAKAWYDGYTVGEMVSVYNPYSVMTAMAKKKYESYWQKTSAAEAMTSYINMNFDGLQEDILRLIAGEELEDCTDSFVNDFETFNSRQDILTLLIHLGYLAYDPEEGLARIPNEEVRGEFRQLLQDTKGNHLAKLVQASRQLLQDTIEGREEKVAEAIAAVRSSEYAPGFYNNEQALRYVIKFAYIVCVDSYMKIEELPSGQGIADVVFIPKRRSRDPALLVELKWNRSAKAAIGQIKEKNYPAVLSDYYGEIVLVGLNYDEKNKRHSCRIEKLTKMAL